MKLPDNHCIDLMPTSPSSDRAVWRYRCDDFEAPSRTSAQPLFDAARWLLSESLADRADRITTYRDGKPCLTASVGVAAVLRIHESDRDGLRFVKFKSHGYVRPSMLRVLQARYSVESYPSSSTLSFDPWEAPSVGSLNHGSIRCFRRATGAPDWVLQSLA